MLHKVYTMLNKKYITNQFDYITHSVNKNTFSENFQQTKILKII